MIWKYRFQPKWPFLLLTFLGLVLFLKLGFWQLDRAHEKTLLQQRFEAGRHAMPVPLNQLPVDLKNQSYQHVMITGTYDNAHNLLLDNKIYEHQVGYEVLTPIQIPGETRSILVNRGWIPAPRQRMLLPNIPRAVSQQTITGRIYIPPHKPFTLENKKIKEKAVEWPYRIQAIDIIDIEQRLNMKLFPFVVQLDTDQDNGFIRDWKPVNMSPHKHQAYAVQWFAFALVLTIIFIALNLKKHA